MEICKIININILELDGFHIFSIAITKPPESP